MKTIGIFYGSSTGTTEGVANQIAESLGVDSADVHEVSQASAEDLNAYEVLLFGSSTWGAGDLQDDWYDFLPKIQNFDLSNKLVALFGCGDSSSFSDTYCDAMGTIYQGLEGTGCKFIGSVDASDYTYDESTAVVDGRFVGLALDEVNEDDKTADRISNWVESLKSEGLE